MTGYIIRRLGQSLIVLFLLSVMFFLLARQQFGNECVSTNLTTQLSCDSLLHLDQPVPEQYVSWIGDLAHGNLGSTPQGVPVYTQIGQALPPTLLLMFISIVLQQIIAIPLGIFSAVRQYSGIDYLLTLLSYALLSIPSFVLGIVLLRVFSVGIGWFPTGKPEAAIIPLLGSGDWWSMLLSDPRLILGDLVLHFALPVAVLTALGVANDSRIVRTAMLQVLHQEYTRTAKAKGVRRRSIVLRHVFKNALLPIVTNIGLYLPTLIGGTVIVETVFTFGGLGQQFASTASGLSAGYTYGNSGAPFVITTLLLASIVVLLANLLTDLVYGLLDPRIRVGETKGA